MPEKRAAQRIPVNLRAYYRSQDTSIEGWVADLSRLGLFLRSEYLDELGAEAVIDLGLPGADEPVRIHGEVVRVDTRVASCGMGIRFAAIPDSARRPLANFMIERSYQTLR